MGFLDGDMINHPRLFKLLWHRFAGVTVDVVSRRRWGVKRNRTKLARHFPRMVQRMTFSSATFKPAWVVLMSSIKKVRMCADVLNIGEQAGRCLRKFSIHDSTETAWPLVVEPLTEYLVG